MIKIVFNVRLFNIHNFLVYKAGCNGQNTCCHGLTSTRLCNVGEGDCDFDRHCLPGLMCGNKNCIGEGFDPSDDCCYDPSPNGDKLLTINSGVVLS